MMPLPTVAEIERNALRRKLQRLLEEKMRRNPDQLEQLAHYWQQRAQRTQDQSDARRAQRFQQQANNPNERHDQ